VSGPSPGRGLAPARAPRPIEAGTRIHVIGAAGAGTIAEKPELRGTVIIMLAIPETMVILGFVIAVMILFRG